MFIKLRMFAALLLLAMSLSTCDSPLGFGDPIDWEAPILTIDQSDTTLYVRQNTRISGRVTDNIIVDRVIMRESGTGKELFTATLSGASPSDKRWHIDMNFSSAQNGTTLAVEIVAYDRTGNSGEQSIKSITIIIDTSPPLLSDMWIQRTDVKRAELEPSETSLKALATSDPQGERLENANKYQNGVFKIMGTIEENETRLKNITLRIYDIDKDTANALLELPLEAGKNVFAPEWLITEENLLDAGEAKGWTNYKTNWYTPPANTTGRYYYRVAITAQDSSSNPNRTFQNYGYFVMWEKADMPKGIPDPIIVGAGSSIEVTQGATIPVDLFDDDQLKWGFTGLLTAEQWNGSKAAGPSFNISGTTNEAKLLSLRNRLVNASGEPTGNIVYNWRYDRYNEALPANQITSWLNVDDGALDIITTGNDDKDNGQFVLFSLVADVKTAPYTNSANIPTYQRREVLKMWNVTVKDNNRPMIIFDTVDTTEDGYDVAIHPGGTTLELIANARTGNSPEENTFPRLTGGKNFTLNGYILRANKKDVTNNIVTKFRMAWIPFAKSNDPAFLAQVQTALKEGYPGSMSSLNSQGVQHWDFPSGTGTGNLITGTPQRLEGTYNAGLPAGTDIFTKQVFKKEFNILGDTVDGTYRHFTVGGTLENEAKLFVLYAEDTMGHVVYKTLRLLGNKTPPDITVYDITDRIITFNETPPNALPNLNNDTKTGNATIDNAYYFKNAAGQIDADGRSRYQNTRKAYQSPAYGLLTTNINTNPLDPVNDIALPNAVYPQDTIIKYWAEAKANGDLAVMSIIVNDVTSSTKVTDVGYVPPNTLKLGYVEKLSEITQRVFQFEATDSLGNKRVVQRTVAVTNAAVLNSITADKQTGTYGIGTRITLRANFTNHVYWTRIGNADTDVNRPKLHVRYNYRGTQIIRDIPTSTPSGQANANLYLEFPIIVEENDTGIIETLYYGIGTSNDNNAAFTPATSLENRPITIPAGTEIIDRSRGDSAFTPGNNPGFVWTTNKGSLQASKLIKLQGVRPKLTSFTLTSVPSGKIYHTTTETGVYYKANETIEFTLASDKDIYTSSVAPIIQFQLTGDSATTWRDAAWSKSIASNSMSFSFLVNINNIQNRQISAVRLNNASSIVDSVGNAFAAGTAPITTAPISNTPTSSLNGSTIIRIDTVAPTAPEATVDPAGTLTSGTYYHNTNPTLTIIGNGGETAGTVTTQYSLNEGVSWLTYTAPATIGNGQHILQTRLVDRAGNEGAKTDNRPMWVNAKFPELKSITAVQPNGTYITGSSLVFNLAFEDAVYRQSNTSTVTITLTNRNADNNNNTGGTNPSYQQVLNVAAPAAATTTITFTWSGITGKEMLNGLYVSAVDFTGLRDRFGNTGRTGTAAATGNAAPPSGNTISALSITNPGNPNPPYGDYTYTCPNLAAGLIVDCIVPRVSTYNPVNADGRAVNNRATSVSGDNKTITLTFNEAVNAGNGTITIKPHGDYFIPPVFENAGYYDSDGAWVPGMTDIFNAVNDTQKTALIGGTSMSDPPKDTRSGQAGTPYVRMTHGLKAGAGYTGNYTSTNGANGPFHSTGDSTSTAYMIPNTTTKWVLDWRYSINNAANSYYTAASNTANPTPVLASNAVVPAVRAALNAAKFRWQEIDVTSSSVSINGSVVTITLPRPLNKGLEWDLYYPAGTFEDKAGNRAAAVAAGDYWFLSNGAQTPVIRVNRKSYDARTGGWQGTGRTFANPTSREANYPSAGWSISDFNTVHYRIETETPNATLSYGTLGEQASNTSTRSIAVVHNNAVTTSWDTAVPGGSGNTNWTANGYDGVGTWVRPNLVRRANNGNATYTVYENGSQITRNFRGNFRGFRSHNRDATVTELTTTGTGSVALSSTYAGPVTPAPTAGATSGFFFTYYPTEASKRYVVAMATINHGTTATTYPSGRGYEGVFRSVIALNQDYTGTGIVVEGSNIKNGIPSIAGFPVKDAEETGDNRFIKMFYQETANNLADQIRYQKLWVSTEIVSQWYFLKWGGQGTHQSVGEVDNYMFAGYGDLNFGYHITGY